MFFINNKVEHNTNKSRTLLEKTENDPQVIATIPNKQLFKATIRKNIPIIDMQSDVKTFNANRKFF
ncbi:ParA-like ATPase involved in chromosome/plasmid partitioning or cellulose biosynthesis protein BcsQ (ParA) [Fructobacillus tropaeoli]|uniref:ParA-like ATPase involved in chromosome/plasmid partitioning or cellulose biosynthesis protein BcsQ (ParA) n=1 Tax=Fructobacillus tropaeoli TaxID=709323 RepID=A0ABM9N1W5_9LACO|nr:ParA-like ATPase involved in chromosome/plasmid partitioning or cellulose biosynthesis protein BcsQ (ParA) [Fructobacillus tropaeoli]